MPILSLICRIIVGSIFLISGLAKISDPVRFIFTLREFRLFPEAIVPFTAVFLPWLEFILGLFILLGLLHRTASLMLAFLNTMFTLAILSVIIRGIDVDCGCFGMLADMLKISDMADMKAVIRNLLFIVMCFYIFRARDSILSMEKYFKQKQI